MQHRAAGVGARRRGRFEHAVDFALADRLAAQRDLGVEQLRRQPAARHVDDDAVDFDPRHPFGGVDRQANRVLGGVEIDDRARLDPARALMADAEHAAAMGAVGQRFGGPGRRQSRDQADHLRRADVEHRQDGRFLRRQLPHARRERAEGHGEAAFFGFERRDARRRRLFRQAGEHLAGHAQVDRQDVAIENARLALQVSSVAIAASGSFSGSLTSTPERILRLQRRSPTRMPASNLRPQLGRGVEQRVEFAEPLVGALADDERQAVVAAVVRRLSITAPSAGDGAELAVLLPQRRRRRVRRCR